MKCREIIEHLNCLAPEMMACSWDNPGLLAGRFEKEVKKIYLALDATDQVILAAAAAGADMLITHHPLIFKAVKKVNDGDFIGRRLVALLQADISYYAMHTNYDVRGMAALACERLGMPDSLVLEVTRVSEDGTEEGIGRIADLDPVTLCSLCERVKKAFGLDTVRLFGDQTQMIRRAAICPGSGKSVIGQALKKGADVLITGDIGHHEGIDAMAEGMAVIDAGHYGIEHIFIQDMKNYLEEYLRDVEIEAASVRHPFTVL